MTKAPEIIGYALEPGDYAALMSITKTLHGDGRAMSNDAQCIANLLSLILPRAQPLTASDFSDRIGLPEDRR